MLKFPSRGFIVLVLCTATSLASATTLITKTTLPGYTTLAKSLTTTCDLDDKGLVIITNVINGLTSKKTTPVQINVAGLRTLINQAELGLIKQPVIKISDSPGTLIYDAYKTVSGKVKTVFLFEDVGILIHNTTNTSSAALTLRIFMDAVCK
jgi:hypothetical protein